MFAHESFIWTPLLDLLRSDKDYLYHDVTVALKNISGEKIFLLPAGSNQEEALKTADLWENRLLEQK